MSEVLRWSKNATGSYSAITDTGSTYTAYGDATSADISRTEWKVAHRSCDAPLTYVGQAFTLREAKTVAQGHHDATLSAAPVEGGTR